MTLKEKILSYLILLLLSIVICFLIFRFFADKSGSTKNTKKYFSDVDTKIIAKNVEVDVSKSFKAIEILYSKEEIKKYSTGKHKFSLGKHWEGFKIAVFLGDLSLKGDLDLDELKNLPWSELQLSGPVSGFWVTGDLKVSGSIVNAEGDYGDFLVVEGKTQAKNIIGGGGDIHLLGGAEAKNSVIGHYNHGILEIRNFLNAQLILREGDHSFYIPDNVKGFQVGLDNGVAITESSFEEEDYGYIFLEEYCEIFEEDNDYEEEGSPDEDVYVDIEIDKIIEAVVNGKRVIKEKLPSQSKKWSRYLAKNENGDGIMGDFEGTYLEKIPKPILLNPEITALNLSHCNFRSFPEELKYMSNLKSIDLSENPLTSLSNKLSLSHLDSLLLFESKGLTFSEVVKFAETIPTLKTLGYSYNSNARSGSLAHDIFLALHDTALEQLKEARKATRKVNYESKILYKSSEHPEVEFPYELKSIRDLYLHNVRLRSINPEKPMTNLTTLSLIGSIYDLSDSPPINWGNSFPSLRKIDLSLNENWAVDLYQEKILQSLSTLPVTLRSLYLDDWIPSGMKIEEKISKIPSLITHLKELEELSFINSTIDAQILIKVLPNFPKLKILHIDNIFSSKEINKIRKSLPKDCELNVV